MTQENIFDLIVIGAGPAGYTASIKAAQLGMKVACIEKNKTLGGTCLNVGCIPSKSLLHFSHLYEQLNHNFHDIGIDASIKSFDVKTMMARKAKVVSDLCSGIDMLFKKNKVTKIIGQARITSSAQARSKDALNEVTVDGQKYKAKNILIATGSEVATLPGIEIDEKRIISSTGALSLDFVPKNMVVVGGGYIGLELGSVWRRLGSDVTVIEYGDSILSMMDKDVAQELYKLLQKQGLKFMLGTKVENAKVNNNKVHLNITHKSDSKNAQELTVEAALISVGRRPFTKDLGLENIGITTDKYGKIPVNHNYQTTISSIFAVGDVIDGPMLAHKAEEEAIAAVEIMAGQKGHVNYNTIPSVIYTNPEVASVGLTEQQIKEQKIDYRVGKFPFLANSRARSYLNTDGFVKILVDKTTDQILGAHIIGHDAGNLISEITLGMEYKAAAEDIARICHPHPTLSEAVKEAANLAYAGKTINF